MSDEVYEVDDDEQTPKLNALLTEPTVFDEETDEERKARQEREQKQDYVQGLRDLADWLEATPSAKTPLYQTFRVYLNGKDHAVRLAKEGGTIRKIYEDDRLHLEKRFGDTIRYTASVNREAVCTVKSIKKVKKEVAHYPDPVYVKQEVEEVEWECDPLLAPTESEV